LNKGKTKALFEWWDRVEKKLAKKKKTPPPKEEASREEEDFKKEPVKKRDWDKIPISEELL